MPLPVTDCPRNAAPGRSALTVALLLAVLALCSACAIVDETGTGAHSTESFQLEAGTFCAQISVRKTTGEPFSFVIETLEGGPASGLPSSTAAAASEAGLVLVNGSIDRDGASCGNCGLRSEMSPAERSGDFAAPFWVHAPGSFRLVVDITRDWKVRIDRTGRATTYGATADLFKVCPA